MPNGIELWHHAFRAGMEAQKNIQDETSFYGDMDRRDWFAAAALAGGLEQDIEHDMASVNPDHHSWWHPAQKIAQRAYEIADAMIDET